MSENGIMQTCMQENVILVNEEDQQIGVAEKMQAHREAKLHRALSIFIFNSEGYLLLQKRTKTKYHSGGLWSNTCCSHPQPGEAIESAAQRRLQQEMGFACAVQKVHELIYKVEVEKDLFENEFDHIFVGKYDGQPEPNPAEVEDWKWMTVEQLTNALGNSPESYTRWLRIMMSDQDLLGRLKESFDSFNRL